MARPRSVERIARRRWPWVVAGLAVGVGIFLFFVRDRPSSIALPEMGLTALDAETRSTLEKYREAVRAQPRQGATWGQLGGVLVLSGQPGPAEECLVEAARLDPGNPRWPYFVALAREEQSTPGPLEPLRRAVALCGNTPEMPRLRLAKYLAGIGKMDEAAQEARQLIEARRDFLPAYLLLAQIGLSKGDWESAAKLAEHCRQSPYTGRAATVLFSTAQRRLGDVAAAKEAEASAAILPPDLAWPDPFEEEARAWRSDPRTLAEQARIYVQTGRFEAAQPIIDRLLRDHPNFPEAWLLQGRQQYQQKQPTLAELSFRSCLRLDPTSLQAYFQLGMALLAQQKFPEAAGAFQEAIALKPEFGPGHFNLGFALMRAGQVREAIAPLRQSIRYNPEKTETYLILADLEMQNGERDAALSTVEQAGRLAPGDPRVEALRRRFGLEKAPAR